MEILSFIVTILVWSIGIAVVIVLGLLYWVYIRPTLKLLRAARVIRRIIAGTDLNKLQFNADGLQYLRNSYTNLSEDDREFINDISLDTFSKLGKFIKR